MTSWGGFPSTVHPTLWAVPRISLPVPDSSRAIDRGLICLATSIMSSKVTLPLCLMFLTFLRSRGGSFKALMMRDEALGTTETVACLFWILSWAVILSPFQSPVFLAMSSPTFLGLRPRGPIFGASDAVAPTSPPVTLRYTYVIAVGSNFGGMTTSEGVCADV